MANPLDEQRTSSLYFNSLSVIQTDHQKILKLQADILCVKLTQLDHKL